MPAPAVTGRAGAADLPAVRAPLFTGRDREQAALAAALDGPPAVVLVEGEAGIGKTRLLREYLTSAPSSENCALVATCPPLARPQTLAPVAEAIRQAAAGGVAGLGLSGLAGALRPLFPEWSDRLPPAPERAEDASAARYRVFAALRELIERLGGGLLVLEDAHWADEATLEFVLYLASTAPRPVSLVLTCRPEDVPAGSLLPRIGRLASGPAGLRLAVSPLDVTQTAGMVSSMLAGADVSGEFAAFLHDRTEGVPLAVEELVRLLVGRDDLARPGDRWIRRRLDTLQVPATIRDAVLERAGRLGADADAVLEAAAVLAEPATDATLAAVTGFSAERLRAGLAGTLACGLLEENARGLVSFRHVLATRAVYEAIPGPGRRAFHERAGSALESQSPPPLAALARHFREAGDTSKWSRYAEQAADAALAAGGETTAAGLLADLVIAAGLPAGEMCRLTSKIALASLGDTLLHDLARVIRAVVQAGNLVLGEEAGVRFQLGRVLLVLDEIDAARCEIEKAVPGLAPGSLQVARAMMLLGVPYGARCPAAEHRRWLERAAETAGSLEPAERLRLLIDLATGLLTLGDQAGWAEASKIPHDASRPQDRFQIVRGHRNVGELAMVWGHYGRARQQLARATELAARYDYARLRAASLADLVRLDWFTGAWDRLADRSAALADDEDLQTLSHLETELVAGLLTAVTGDRGNAEDRLRYVLREVLRRGVFQDAGEPAAALATLALADGDSETALMVTGEPTGIITRKGVWIWATNLIPARVEALAAAGRYEEAQALAQAFARGLRGRDAPAPKAGLALCRAILAEPRGEHARVAALFGRAAAAWQALPRPYHALLARERQARCLLAASRTEAGLDLLAETRRELAALGASGDAARATDTLREHGVVVPRVVRGGRRGYGGRLSPRELEVVRLVAEGRTNREVAQALCRSPSTVDTQLTSAMRKLNVSSRTALATRLAGGGAAAPGVPHARDHARERH
jgi:DNA-binding CsgD family transcriptional regulator